MLKTDKHSRRNCGFMGGREKAASSARGECFKNLLFTPFQTAACASFSSDCIPKPPVSNLATGPASFLGRFYGSTHLLNLKSVEDGLSTNPQACIRRADRAGHCRNQIDLHSSLLPFPEVACTAPKNPSQNTSISHTSTYIPHRTFSIALHNMVNA